VTERVCSDSLPSNHMVVFGFRSACFYFIITRCVITYTDTVTNFFVNDECDKNCVLTATAGIEPGILFQLHFYDYSR
jgi:hypothetical protein